MRAHLLSLSFLVGACSAVPDLTFPPDDAGGSDAGASDGSSQRDAADSAADTCTKLDSADVCCGTRTCSGDCSASSCTKCASTCSPSELCCAKNGKVTCTPRSKPACN